MHITVNGEPRELGEGTALGELLSALNVPLEAVAVAVNLQVVPRSQLAEHALSDGDRVEVVRAVGGG